MSVNIEYIKYNNIKIPIVFEKDNKLPTYNLQLVFTNSGYIEDNNKPGLAYISANLLNEGTKKINSIKFANKLENRAIELYSSIGFETFVIELSSLIDNKNEALKLLINLLKYPNYNNQTLKKIKTKQIGILKQKESDFDYIANRELKKVLFKNSPLENTKLGTVKSIHSIKLKNIRSFIKNNIILENLVIVVGGDISFKKIQKDISKLLKNINNGKKNKNIKFKTSDIKDTKIMNKQTQQAYIYFGSPFNNKNEKNKSHMLKVTSFILGSSGFGSRLMEEIRVKRGLAYSIYGYIVNNKSSSSFNGYLQTELKSTNRVKELVIKIIEKFVNNGVTQKELDSAKKFLIGSEPLRTETLNQRLNSAFNLFYNDLDINHNKQELENIENLSLKDLNSYIRSHKEIINLSFSIVKD